MNTDIKQVTALTKLCAKLILENGGETYRVEETVSRIGHSLGFDTEIMAIPTGFYFTLTDDHNHVNTIVKRIKVRSVNLEAIHKVNDISRQIVFGQLEVGTALEILKELEHYKIRYSFKSYLAAYIASAFFSLLSGGGLFDSIVAGLCGSIVRLLFNKFEVNDVFNFALSMISGVIIAIISIIFVEVFNKGNLDIIITGAMTPLLPGLAMTTAIRDAMRGDLLSGVSRTAEGLLVAIALAFGISSILSIYS